MLFSLFFLLLPRGTPEYKCIYGRNEEKEKRNRDIWVCDGGGERVGPPRNHPSDLRAAP